MARFDTSGLDRLVLDMDEIAEIPDEIIEEMLTAGGEIIAEGHRAALDEEGLINTGKLRASVAVQLKSGSSKYALVGPQGVHHTYKRKAKGGKASGKANATNQEVGFVHEFGGHGNRSRQWMRRANEKNASKAVDAQFAVLDRWHKSKGL